MANPGSLASMMFEIEESDDSFSNRSFKEVVLKRP